jgi:Predicted transcriptional regulators
MADRSTVDQLFNRLGLGEYETTALRSLLTHGRSTAPNLAEATGIPNARIYGVLDSLADRGFIKIIPGRPKEYQPKAPAEILDRAVENRQQELASFESEVNQFRDVFINTFQAQYERASEEISPAADLFHVVDVGDPSESETRSIYRDADQRINIMTKSLEYFDRIRSALADAIDRGITVDILFLHPQHLAEHNADTQQTVVRTIRQSFSAVGIRFSNEQLPWRGTLADPSMEYDTGTAIILVEENNVPLHMRQAAVTENGSFVAGLRRYFDLIWTHESRSYEAIDYDTET